MFIKYYSLVSIFLVSLSTQANVEIITENYSAEFQRGVLCELSDAGGSLFVSPAKECKGGGLHRVGADHWAQNSAAISNGERLTNLSGLEGAHIENHYLPDKTSGELIITQQADSPQKGVWGVEWSIEYIPLDMNVILPAHSGTKLTRRTPGSNQYFDYPMSWEAQFVLVEGKDRGFYVWAEDAQGVFKRLTVDRRTDGWRLGFITMPLAPFEEQSACDPVKWRLGVYEGDWRIPAKRYRDWMVKAFQPTPLEQQNPTWMHDIRACIIMGLEVEVLNTLATRMEPEQTLLYIPGWRAAGYDRDYPTYDKVLEPLVPFIQRAHELGFRVMLHVNYFGCDPLNPAYAGFERYQVRSPWGNHDKEWWLWSRADPIIKFAYINPACKAWRELFTGRMKTLCETFNVDALHLDQTLCTYNDYNGRIDGMTMMEGNIALHRELREALPHVALSGEGLNEITYRHEAFAQRHAMGINHPDGTFDRQTLSMAHPVSSYLFRPFTTIYGYLGIAPPTDAQLYAAWWESYRYWGVIPTLKPALPELLNPSPFTQQFFDEAGFWQKEGVSAAVDAAWPENVAFPLITETGDSAAYMVDRRLVCGNREIGRTISDVSHIALPGTIPGWRAFNDHEIIGLEPEYWYPYFSTRRMMDGLHLTRLPDGFTVGAVVDQPDLRWVQFKSSSAALIRIAPKIADATCASCPFTGDVREITGELHDPDGALFYGTGDAIFAHPPYQGGRIGVARAHITLRLPDTAQRFVSEVAMDTGAVGEGRTDGVLYGARILADGKESSAELLQATSDHKELVLDLRPFAGKEAVLELSVHPGPAKSPNCDWARWYSPRIECNKHIQAEVELAGIHTTRLVLSGKQETALAPDAKSLSIKMDCPGTVYLLPESPSPITLPWSFKVAQSHTAFLSAAGTTLESPPHACVMNQSSTVDGIMRDGIFMHPPDHGRTVANFIMQLPETPVEFHGFVGIRDTSKSDGVLFLVEANGEELHRQLVLPGAWHELICDLSPWAGKPLVLSLVTDSNGSFVCDWAHWGEPAVRVK